MAPDQREEPEPSVACFSAAEEGALAARPCAEAISQGPALGVIDAIKHRRIDSIGKWLLFERYDGNLYAVGSVRTDRYLVVPESKVHVLMRVLEHLDGTHDLSTIGQKIADETGKATEIEALFVKLQNAGLIATALPRERFQSEFLRHSLVLLEVNVQTLFARLRWLGAVFSPGAMVLGLAIGAFGLGLVRWHQLVMPHRQTVLDSHALSYIVLWLGLLAIVLLHESFHGFAAVRFGLEPRKLSVALYLGFVPYVYLTIPGLYTVKPKHRLIVWFAGIYSNFLFAGILQIARTCLQLQPEWDGFLGVLVLTNVTIILFNLSPFMATDGYFLLSTLLKTPNARTNAFSEFQRWRRGKAHEFRPVLIVYFVLSVGMIGYGLWSTLRWLVATAVLILRSGLSHERLADLAPLFLFAAAATARIFWKRRERIQARSAPPGCQARSATQRGH